MNNVIAAASELQSVCSSEGWRFCFIGGLAVLRWGEPRTTVDADLTLLTGFGGERRFIQVLLKEFESRVPNAEQFALDRRVLLLRTASGIGLDVSLGGLPYEELVVDRASDFAYPQQTILRTCSAEDLIILKAFASRVQDWIDVQGVIAKQTGKLDWSYIRQQLGPLAEMKEEPEILDQLERRRTEFEK